MPTTTLFQTKVTGVTSNVFQTIRSVFLIYVRISINFADLMNAIASQCKTYFASDNAKIKTMMRPIKPCWFFFISKAYGSAGKYASGSKYAFALATGINTFLQKRLCVYCLTSTPCDA